MRRNRFFIHLALILPLASLVLAGTTASRALAEDTNKLAVEKEIWGLEAEFSEAILKADLKTFDRLMAEDFTHTNQSGTFRTKAQWLANHKPGESAYDAYDVDELAVRVYGDAVLVTGRTTPKGRDSKGQPITGQFRFTRVWAKRGGQWQAVAFQGTRIASP